MRPPAVFLDRDGVLNRAIVRNGKPYPPESLAELEIAAGAAGALARLKAAGYRLVVVTNQPDVAAGRQRREVVESINAALSAALPIDEVRVCYHDEAHKCGCRKPATGLLTDPPLHDLDSSIIVGDRWRDIEAGKRANLRATVLIEGHYDERYVTPHYATDSIERAVDWILALPPRGAIMKALSDLRVKIFADGADLPTMRLLASQAYISGFTTNPTLMHKAGVDDYRTFARGVLAAVPDRPVSFEVLSDDFPEMEAEAREISAWGPCVYVKVPVTNTAGRPSYEVIQRLSQSGVRVNVTAILTIDQVRRTVVRVERRCGGSSVRLRRPDCRYRSRSCPDHAGSRGAHEGDAADRADLGEPARVAERVSGR